MAVTPVRTGPLPTSSGPSPMISVVCPTRTPATSVIALAAPDREAPDGEPQVAEARSHSGWGVDGVVAGGRRGPAASSVAGAVAGAVAVGRRRRCRCRWPLPLPLRPAAAGLRSRLRLAPRCLASALRLAALLAQPLEAAFEDLADQRAVLDAGRLRDQAEVRVARRQPGQRVHLDDVDVALRASCAGRRARRRGSRARRRSRGRRARSPSARPATGAPGTGRRRASPTPA